MILNKNQTIIKYLLKKVFIFCILLYSFLESNSEKIGGSILKIGINTTKAIDIKVR
jgi:hypothetical protein